jgi:hypothetical protein
MYNQSGSPNTARPFPEIAKEIHIDSMMAVALACALFFPLSHRRFLLYIGLSADTMVKTPYGFPLVGGRKVEGARLSKNLLHLVPLLLLFAAHSLFLL